MKVTGKVELRAVNPMYTVMAVVETCTFPLVLLATYPVYIPTTNAQIPVGSRNPIEFVLE